MAALPVELSTFDGASSRRNDMSSCIIMSNSSSSSSSSSSSTLATMTNSRQCRRRRLALVTTFVVLPLLSSCCFIDSVMVVDGFQISLTPPSSSSSLFTTTSSSSSTNVANPVSPSSSSRRRTRTESLSCLQMTKSDEEDSLSKTIQRTVQDVTSIALAFVVAASVMLSPGAVHAEDELAAKYGNGKGFDTSLVDQTCLVETCGIQAKACLKDDPSCRKGLTCTAKCMGDNGCITGCMARYGNSNLDNLLKCTIEDHECIKVAILEGGSDTLAQAPKPPAPVVSDFQYTSLEGTWYKVMGYNPNYDCYACQRNTFASSDTTGSLQVDVEFSMPHLLPDGSPAPPSSKEREQIVGGFGAKSIGMNEYKTHELMKFDSPEEKKEAMLTLNKGSPQEMSYMRTAHSEGEMFGLKFWENWYVIGENDPLSPEEVAIAEQTGIASNEEFKFIYYNGKTRQNTYEGAFVYSRSKELGPRAMQKIYSIASEANMNPNQFCKIRNGCFADEEPNSNMLLPQQLNPQNNRRFKVPVGPFRGILASTKVSELLGVDSVAAANVEPKLLKQVKLEEELLTRQKFNSELQQIMEAPRSWWYEVGDYLENPHRHFDLMKDLRQTVEWPSEVVSSSKTSSSQ